jgi:hypothetical protein
LRKQFEETKSQLQNSKQYCNPAQAKDEKARRKLESKILVSEELGTSG